MQTNTQKITRELKREFTETEIEEMSETVFTNIASVVELKVEKKESNRSFSDKIKSLEETNIELGHLIQQGHKMEPIACEVTYNKPKDGIKTIVRTDTFEYWEEEMLPSEYNLENLPPLVNDGSNDEDEEDLEPVTADDDTQEA